MPVTWHLSEWKTLPAIPKSHSADTDDADMHKNLGMILITLFSYHQQTSWKDSVFVF